jgi:hypothetical protein
MKDAVPLVGLGILWDVLMNSMLHSMGMCCIPPTADKGGIRAVMRT